jgi:hypothetical protein
LTIATRRQQMAGDDWGGSATSAIERRADLTAAAGKDRRYTVSASMGQRPEHLFIDYLRNGRGSTAIGTWSHARGTASRSRDRSHGGRWSKALRLTPSRWRRQIDRAVSAGRPCRPTKGTLRRALIRLSRVIDFPASTTFLKDGLRALHRANSLLVPVSISARFARRLTDRPHRSAGR